jgi:hypothetical protein
MLSAAMQKRFFARADAFHQRVSQSARKCERTFTAKDSGVGVHTNFGDLRRIAKHVQSSLGDSSRNENLGHSCLQK